MQVQINTTHEQMAKVLVDIFQKNQTTYSVTGLTVQHVPPTNCFSYGIVVGIMNIKSEKPD